MNFFVPKIIEPIGDANPLLRQNMTESAGFTSSLTGTFCDTAALKIRAPSICKCKSWQERRRPFCEVQSRGRRADPGSLLEDRREPRVHRPGAARCGRLHSRPALFRIQRGQR